MSLFQKKKIIFVMAASFLLMPLGSSLASAKTCKSYYVSVSGDKKISNLQARVSARWSWHKRVKSTKGFKWSSWSLARNKSYSCRRVGLKWRCQAKARPCKLF